MADEIITAETNEQVDATQQEEVQGANEVAETSTEQKDVQVEEQQAKQQTKEENSKFARLRREREIEEKVAKAREEAKVQTIIDTIGENPYTNKPLVDAKDVEQYLIMKQIDKDGGNPLNDYPEYQKKAEIKRENDAKESADAKQKNIDDVKDFQAKYPNVNLEDLGKDALFDEFCGDKLGKVPLATLYESYQKLYEKVRDEIGKKEQDKQVIDKAKKNASAGSLGTSAEMEDDIYTIEELKKLTREELDKNWAKVSRSRKKYNI